MAATDSIELWAVFRAEAAETLDLLAEQVGALRGSAAPTRDEAIDDAMRLAHNLKGASSSVGAEAISAGAHALEDSLAALKGAASVPDEAVDDMLGKILLMQRQIEPAASAGSAAAGGQASAEAGRPSPGGPGARDGEAFGHGPSTLRVETDRLDRLMAFAGDLFLTRARLRERGERLEDLQEELLQSLDETPALRPHVGWLLRRVDGLLDDARRDHRRFVTLADDMGASLRSIRMIPLSVAAPGWRQTIRDAAQRLGKRVELSFGLGDVEVDKRILENLYDPVNHLLRNAVDHGIEPAQEREAAGKPAPGRITLQAQPQGNRLRLTVEDDGRGVDVEGVVEHARRHGVHTASQLETMSEREIVDLLFHPGFSTRAEVSRVSGRGIGLDAVRRQLERVGGRIEVDVGREGHGASFVLSVPVSIMSTQGLLVKVCDEVVALPIDHVERAARVEAGLLRQSEGAPVVSLGESDPLRLRWLRTLFGEPEHRSGEYLTIVVLSAGDSRLGLVVDAVVGQAEYVTKPLPWNVRNVRGVNGAVLAEDGAVALALDVPGLFDLLSGNSQALPESRGKSPTILVVDDSPSIRALHRSILATAGYRVVVATDGEEAWKLLERQPVDLVVSDILMPNVDGFELTRRIRAHPRFQSLPVILVTSLASAADVERGVSAGANEYIVKKPFDHERFLQAVTTHL